MFSSRLYFKLYIYFLAVIFVIFAVVPAWFFYSVDKPYRNIVQKRMALMAYVINSSLFEHDVNSALKEISEQTNCDIALYDKAGNVKISTGEREENLDDQMMKKIEKHGSFIDISKVKNRVFFLTPLEDKSSKYFYMSITTDFGDTRNRVKKFIFGLIIICSLLSLFIYPISIYLTRPIEKITDKAIKFSTGDFSGIEKTELKKITGKNELTKLDTAFNNMACELIGMIEAKKELLSDISHELGSPLSRMKLALELIDEKVREGKVPSIKTVESISEDINEMSVLVKELLELSKMDLKSYVLNIRKSNMEELVDNCVKSFEIMAQKNNIKLNVHKNIKSNEISIDPDKISRVLQNLISNAIKYSPENSDVNITLKEETEYVTVSVKDGGPGILKENGEKIPAYKTSALSSLYDRKSTSIW